MKLKKFISIAAILISSFFPNYTYSQNNAEPKSKKAAVKNSLEGKVTAYFINVGQGDSTFVKNYYGLNILVDCGDNGKGQLVVDYLKSLGVNTIDILVATHPHSDHIGGCGEIMAEIPVKSVIDNGQEQHTQSYKDYIMAAKQRNYHKILSDSTISNMRFFVAYNSTYSSGNTNASYMDNTNDNSLVVLFRGGSQGFSMLVTGDCGDKCEKKILAKLSPQEKQEFDIDLLKVGHHGSRTATTDDLLIATTPKTAVISAGKGNKYGHPHKETLEKLKAYNIQVFITYEAGSLTLY